MRNHNRLESGPEPIRGTRADSGTESPRLQIYWLTVTTIHACSFV